MTTRKRGTKSKIVYIGLTVSDWGFNQYEIGGRLSAWNKEEGFYDCFVGEANDDGFEKFTGIKLTLGDCRAFRLVPVKTKTKRKRKAK